MRAYPQFIRYIVRPSANRPGKTDKFPIHPTTGRIADAHDPAIWLTADAALACTVGDGCGFTFTEQDPFFFLDIDNALTTAGWSATATQLCQQFAGCFIEVSQSGTGLHIFGTTPPLQHGTRNQALGLELYTKKRFAALTGIHATGDAGHPADLTPLLAMPGWSGGSDRPDSAEWTTEPRPEWSGPESDADLITRMLASRPSAGSLLGGKATVQQLWNADADALGRCYPDSRPEGYDCSSADAALCAHLAFWTGCDCERMDRLMRLSGLMRSKWGDRRDYRERTILGATARCSSVLGDRPATAPADDVPSAPDPLTGLRAGFQLMGTTGQIAHFAGCVYVRSEDSIFVPDGDLLKPGQFKASYGGYQFGVDLANEKVTKSAWEAFTESQGYHFPKVQEMCFRPEHEPGAVVAEEGRSMVNTYVPIQTDRRPGDPTPWLNHVAKMLPDPHDQAVLLAYMAALVQYPGQKFFWAPLVQGVQGNGKTLLITTLAHAIGMRYTHLPNPEDIANKFNSWIIGKLFVGVEEAYVADRQEMVSVLKILVANDRVDIQGKGANQKTGDNRANFMMTTNHRDAIRYSDEERRFAIFFTAQQELAHLERDGMGGQYFPEMYAWLRAEGYAVVNDFLRSYQIPDALNPATHCHRAPITSSTGEARGISLGAVEQEVMEAIEEGRPGFAGGWVSSLALDRLLDDRRLASKVPRNRRRDLLRTLGYDCHPGLKDGRVNNTIMDAGLAGKPRLYIRAGLIASQLTTPAEIVRVYQEAQQGTATVASLAMGQSASPQPASVSAGGVA
jgi:hypothetical protein